MINETAKSYGFVDVMTNVPPPREKTKRELAEERQEQYRREKEQRRLAKQKAEEALVEREEKARKFRDLIADAKARQHW